MDTKNYLKSRCLDAKKIVVFQNINSFSIPSLKFVGINPTHRILVVGRRKRKKHSHKIDTKRNYENVAMILKDYYWMYLMSLYLVGVYLICTKLYLI